MNARKLEKCRQRLLSVAPLIGGLLQRRAARLLGRDDSPEAAQVLAEAVTHSKDEKFQAAAINALLELSNQSSIDAACEVWESTRNDDLTRLLTRARWAATKRAQLRVLTALKTGQLNVVTAGNEEMIDPLLQALSDKDIEISERARQCILSLQNTDAIDALCHKWAESRDDALAEAVTQARYVARKPISLRVLTALKIGNLDVVIQGEKDVVEPLIRACKDNDADIAANARKCLPLLQNLSAIDDLCQRWAEKKEALLTQAIVEARYVARQPVKARVMSALKNGQPDVVIGSGAEMVEHLLSACYSNDSQIMECARQCLLSLTDQAAIDLVCAEWASRRTALLTEAIGLKKYVASQPVSVRVLTALKVEQPDIVICSDEEAVEPLLQACGDSDAAIADGARQCLVSLKNSSAINAVCRLWVEARIESVANARTDLLGQAITQGKYVAWEPANVRVLSALKAEEVDVVTGSGAEVVEPLLEACEDADKEIARKARAAIRHLKNREAREAVCRLVIEQDSKIARQIALDAKYAPQDANQRALFFFLTKQWEKYEGLDFDRTMLRREYETADEKMRQRIAKKARQEGRAEWVQVVSGGHRGRRLVEMTDAEWRTALAVLGKKENRNQAWILAQVAPPKWSKQLLQRLKAVGWQQEKGDDDFNELLGLAEKCSGDVPLSTPRVIDLSSSPVSSASLKDLNWAQQTLRKEELPAEDRSWLHFIEALIERRLRFDIEIGEASSSIAIGEFDIEIEG